MKCQTFKECIKLIKADYSRLDNKRFRGGYVRFLITNASFKTTFWFRIGQYLRSKKGILFRMLYCVVIAIYKHNSWKTGIQLPIETKVGGGLFFPHHGCIVINGDAVIGNNCTIFQCVTIGYSEGKNKGVPVIGDNVSVCCGATVIGNICIGNNSTLGAGAVVIDNIPESSTAIGVPAKYIRK